jgi:hypothetical protein
MLRSLVRAAVAVAVALGAVVGLLAPAAHADTLPGNLAVPFPAAAYSNGCSFPGPNLLLDQQPFPDAPFGFPWLFVVNFRPACDMHDAGYDGGIVFDPVNGPTVDTRTLSRLTIDLRFLGDLRTLCNRTIPPFAPAALASCHAVASVYFTAVRAAGTLLFDANPAVTGTQLTGTRPNN